MNQTGVGPIGVGLIGMGRAGDRCRGVGLAPSGAVVSVAAV